MVTSISHSPAETEALGEAWGRAAREGWLIGLSGDLGAGKTQLVRGLARGLGASDRVHSPTFALVNEYAHGRLPLFHLDLYRLERPDQILSAGLEEYLLEPRGVVVVEWIEHWLQRKAEGKRKAEGRRQKAKERQKAEGRRQKAEGQETPEDFAFRTPHCALRIPEVPHSAFRGGFRWVRIELLGEWERRISYEDFGA